MQEPISVNPVWLSDIERKLMRRISLEFLITDMLSVMPESQAEIFRKRHAGIDTLNRQGYYVPQVSENVVGNCSGHNASPTGLTDKQEAPMGGEEE